MPDSIRHPEGIENTRFQLTTCGNDNDCNNQQTLNIEEEVEIFLCDGEAFLSGC